MHDNLHTAQDFKGLAEELKLLRKTLAEMPGIRKSECPEKVLAVFRLLPDVSPLDWAQIASEAGLEDCLALPLDGSLYPITIQLQKTITRLIHKSDHDPLTGLANKRVFEHTLSMECERTRRNQTPLTLAILDLDNFKAINDTYGHACGDTVLSEVSKILQESTRRYDLAARIGGEEFAIILSGVGISKARAKLERLLEDFRELAFGCGERKFSITASVGLASYRGRKNLSEKELFELADRALYDAKSSGKDKIVAAPLPDISAVTPEKTLVHSNEKKFLFSAIK